MKKLIKTPITAAYKEGFVSIWWYTDEGEFWDFSVTTDDAVEYHGYLQYSDADNHLTLWKRAVNTFVEDASKRNEIISKGYKSLERGRVVFNIRTQCYEVICSSALVNDPAFRKACVVFITSTISGRYYYEKILEIFK